MAIRGLVFDFDGLIIDTEIPEYEAWQQVYREYDAELPLDKWMLVLGASYEAFNPIHYLQTCTGLDLDYQTILQHHHSIADEIGLSSPVLPGVREYIEEAAERNLKLAVASSSGRDWVTQKLEQAGLLPYFECVYTKDEVSRVKPDPELYQSAVLHLGIQPNEAIAFEDSPNGVTAAKTAGLFCVAVPNMVSRSLPLSHADMIVDSLAEIPLENLLKHFSNNYHA